MKKISDETAAAIFLFTWIGFMYLGLLMDMIGESSIGWYLFGIDTAIQITILYFDTKLTRKEEQLARTRRYLAELSSDYMEYIRTHSSEIIDRDSVRTTVIEVSSRRNGRKIQGKFSRKVG